MAASFMGEPVAADIQGVGTASGASARGGGERSLPAGEVIVSTEASVSPAAGGTKRASSVRAALAEHLGKIFVLPSGRRLPVDTLLDYLAETGSGSSWAEGACEVRFAEKIEPWATPSSAPCWERMRGPLWHLWSVDTAEPRKLIGLIIPDQRLSPPETESCPPETEGSPVATEWEPLFPEARLDVGEEPDGEPPPGARSAGGSLRSCPHVGEPAVPVTGAPSGEIELSSLVVEGEYHPRLAETDPAILALTPPAGDGWKSRWWKLGSRPLWQYGWWR